MLESTLYIPPGMRAVRYIHEIKKEIAREDLVMNVKSIPGIKRK